MKRCVLDAEAVQETRTSVHDLQEELIRLSCLPETDAMRLGQNTFPRDLIPARSHRLCVLPYASANFSAALFNPSTRSGIYQQTYRGTSSPLVLSTNPSISSSTSFHRRRNLLPIPPSTQLPPQPITQSTNNSILNNTMSREEYQIPTGSGSASVGGGAGAGAGGSSYNAPAARDYTSSGVDGGGTMYYMCGDCAVRVPLEKGAAIRCQKCGARVLYKERTKR